MQHLSVRSLMAKKLWWVAAKEDRRAKTDVNRRPVAEKEGDIGTNSGEGGDRDSLTIGDGPTNTLTSANQGTTFILGKAH